MLWKMHPSFLHHAGCYSLIVGSNTLTLHVHEKDADMPGERVILYVDEEGYFEYTPPRGMGMAMLAFANRVLTPRPLWSYLPVLWRFWSPTPPKMRNADSLPVHPTIQTQD